MALSQFWLWLVLTKSAIPHHHIFHFFNFFFYSDSCWCFEMFYHPTFFTHQNVRTDLTYMWVQFKFKYLVLIVIKMDGEKESIFPLTFCDTNSMEAFPLMKYELVVQRKEGHILSYHVRKQKPKEYKKILFQNSKDHDSKQTWKENSPFMGFFLTNRSVVASPPQKCASIFADSESCEQCGDFGTWVGRWSKWNGGVTTFHIFSMIMWW